MTKMLPSMKICVPLLWGVFFWFAVESTTTSTPENRTANFTVEINDAVRRTTTAEQVVQPATWNSMHKHEDVSPAVEKAVSQTNATEKSEGVIGDKGGSSKDAVTTVAADTSKLPAPTEELKTNSDAPATTKGLEMFSTPTTKTTSEAQPAPVEATTRVTTVTMATTEVQPSPSVTTSRDEAQPPHNTTGTFNQTSDRPHPSSASVFTYKTTPETTPATDVATVTVSSQQPPFVTGITSEKPSTTSSNVTTQNMTTFIPDISSPTSLSPTPEKATTNLSSVSQSVSTTSTLPSKNSETARPAPATTESPSSTTLNSTSPVGILIPRKPKRLPIPTTNPSTLPSKTSETARPTPATTESPSSTTLNSTSPVGILIPRKPKRLPIPTSKPAPAATAIPCEASKNSPSVEFQTCSTRGVAKQCLIVIAILAGLATIFMLSTIVLCIKLSARKPKAKKKQATEMTCISSLLPERTRTYTRHRNPISNGVLVLPGYGDSDEEGGDNVTLSSFLPENDRYV